MQFVNSEPGFVAELRKSELYMRMVRDPLFRRRGSPKSLKL